MSKSGSAGARSVTDRRLIARIATVFAPDSKKAGKLALDRVRSRAADEPEGAALATLLEADARVGTFLTGVFGSSPYLTDLAARDPGRLARILTAEPERLIDDLVAAARTARAEDEAALMARLRHLKQETALALALADLAGALPTLAVTEGLTRFADACLSAAVDHALREAAGRGKIALIDADEPARGSGLILLAMGKQGAYELNYSSDVDLIVFFDHARVRDRLADPDEAVDLFVRITKRMVRIMQERTADGYVFRVDLRLRPDPGATPIAMSVDAALQYYESMGQNWERAALIKARPCAGDIAAGEAFLNEIRPYIWRKYFDYAAIADVHSIKRQIHAHRGHGDIAVEGHNVKLGRGGIREIEFFVQTQQLIAGGRNPRLRGRATLAMLDELVDLGWIGARVRDELAEAYLFLRAVEHRIQMVADEQTHTLPETAEGVGRIARMMGFRNRADFATALRQRLATVQGHYAHLFESAPELSSGRGNLVFTGDDDDPGTIETLSRLGYARPADVTAAIRAWHFGRYAATRSTVARERLTELTPALVEALAATANADAAFLAFDRFVARLPAGIQIFSILVSNPRLLSLFAVIMGSAPKLAETLSRRPRVIDAVLEPAFFDVVPHEAELKRRLEQSFAEAASYEDLLDRARIFAQEQMFLIGVRILTGTLSIGQAGVAYATLAGLLVAAVLGHVETEMARVHGRIAGGSAAVVAMGKLGGREMTAASDLDLILVYDFAADADMSDGPKPLMAGQYYARLTQRLIAALSAPTAEGAIYAVDFRLRPSGNKGPVATSLAAFRDYQAREAWTWERMALTRARVVAGPPAFAAVVEDAIREALARPLDPDRLRADVAEMRGLIEADKGTRDIWDIKQHAGGLVDLEFIAQYLMLRHGPAEPALFATNTAVALERLAARGHLAPGDAEVLQSALRLYQALTQWLRLAQDGAFDPKTAPGGLVDLIARAGEAPDLRVLAARLQDSEAAVRGCFERIIGRPRA
ncbi:bifunctional [glutamine synthetase] adenylyltransferase/[glutamine synthetase]-adenylyl-L-tyrosine phosphorylase [Prosthecodimorpha staleyi]|uniref:Bifunctional glutamine synthetase adenylyltransferase/adenylyl-removing enzyme n=1 Tax=Prosthecodimorpha staleyi TaxID=2840188 RepID=A0A947D196_9HYPH|nr:bifunctional [glutamine synthetase] adenylyltransferase/[glutamine synthetase]-adenylyl-L-tyrosine phosphorylase [Prosthecodimorpha staleyi]MBT9289093.1 bifunctional [glutamine synthetase] adenylyltransferase/[glutamine synthetase]-adenylyl-L-tyrosine phosphorylase [Prosthecodimorpha staleyi]